MIRRSALTLAIVALFPALCFAQASTPVHVMPGTRAAEPQSATTAAPNAPTSDLTLQDAEKMAIANHPRVQASAYLAAVAKAQVAEAKSDYYPHAYGSATGVMAENNSRIAAGALNNPIIYDRFANGITVDQLVTDFGRTHRLVKSAKLHSQAQDENVVTSRADVLFEVDTAYYNALKAQAVLQVAEQTVKTRQLVSDQVTALEQNKLRSGLDVTFANVDLAQAKLLLVQAQNDLQASFAELSDALGLQDQRTFNLIEQPAPIAPPDEFAPLLVQALRDRPEIISQHLDLGAAQSFATAQRDLWFPTISATGVAGLTPVREDALAPRYAAGGFNVNIPIFNGRQFNALHAEAKAQAGAQEQNLRDLENGIARDVRKAWLNAQSGFQRLGLTQQLLDQANQALDLAQQRYKLGLSSIIELSQAQLNQTQAEIAQASAKYDYEAELSALNFQIGALQ
ncbi:MAG: TolC family protein [Candidatus Acidiferrales bacterium]